MFKPVQHNAFFTRTVTIVALIFLHYVVPVSSSVEKDFSTQNEKSESTVVVRHDVLEKKTAAGGEIAVPTRKARKGQLKGG